MTEVGVKTLKDQLSEYLRRVREGERIVITDRGNPIAMLSPMEESTEVQRAWSLVDAGVAHWNGGKPRGVTGRPRNRGKLASDIVLEDRR